MTETQAPATKRRSQIPAWLGVVLIMLALAGGMYVVYQFVLKDNNPSGVESVALENVTGPVPTRIPYDRGGGRGGRQAFSWRDRDGLNVSDGVVYARRGSTYLRAVRQKDGKFDFSIDYLAQIRTPWLTPDQNELHYLAVRIVMHNRMGQFIGLTPEQRKGLEGLSYALALAPAERSQLESLLGAWDKAAAGQAKDTAAEQLLAGVNSIGNTHLAATKAAVLKRAQQIPVILTAEQIAKAKQFTNAPPAPTTVPTRTGRLLGALNAVPRPSTRPSTQPVRAK